MELFWQPAFTEAFVYGVDDGELNWKSYFIASFIIKPGNWVPKDERVAEWDEQKWAFLSITVKEKVDHAVVKRPCVCLCVIVRCKYLTTLNQCLLYNSFCHSFVFLLLGLSPRLSIYQEQWPPKSSKKPSAITSLSDFPSFGGDVLNNTEWRSVSLHLLYPYLLRSENWTFNSLWKEPRLNPTSCRKRVITSRPKRPSLSSLK